MGTGRIFASLAVLLSASVAAGCTIYTSSSGSGSRPPSSHHSSHSSSSRSSGSKSSSTTPAAPAPGQAGAEQPQQPAAKPVPLAPGQRRAMRAQLLGGGRGGRAVKAGPFDVPPWSAGQPEAFAPGVAEGRPAGFRPGAPAGYWIWLGPRGDWRLRTTTANAPHVFRGRIKGMTGAVVNVHPVRTEHRDRVARTNDGWMFNFRTQGHADGFTFGTQDGGCVRFDLHLDGGPVPKKVFIGQKELQPQAGHFVLCPHPKRAKASQPRGPGMVPMPRR